MGGLPSPLESLPWAVPIEAYLLLFVNIQGLRMKNGVFCDFWFGVSETADYASRYDRDFKRRRISRIISIFGSENYLTAKAAKSARNRLLDH
jgi:hypothetical protein